MSDHKEMFMTRPRFAAAWVCFLAGSLVLTALTVRGAVVPRAAPGQKPDKTAAVPLTVVVEDAGMRIRSDGQGPYVNGQQGVSAHIDEWGNLIINFQSRRAADRKLYYDYSEPLDGQIPGGEVAPPNNYFSTLRQPETGVKMQQLAVGASQCVVGGPQYTLEDEKKTQYRHSFHRGGIFDVSDTAYLLVTRTGGTTWTVDSVNTCSGGNWDGAALLISTPTVGKFDFANLGRYRMPMRLLLTAN
jgi:hypothetical protein